MSEHLRTMHNLLRTVRQTQGASDLILAVGRPPQLRLDTEIVPIEQPVLAAEDTRGLCMSILTDDQRQRFEREREIDLSYELAEVARFRVNIFQQRGSCSLVARIVMDQVPQFDALGLPPIVTELAGLRKGLVLITGPTGHGKSTSVASIIDYINHRRRCHIISIEDPIEYVHRHKLATIQQREVGLDTESFHAALRRVLRQAPDVIVIGEIRDLESAQAALTLAETGHLILATLHTSGAVESINRLIDMFPAEHSQQIRTQMSASLAAVLWQQLLPKAGGGLCLACEVMVTIPAIRALIRQGRIHEVYSLIQTGKKFGMITMEQSMEDLVACGRVDADWLGANYFDLGKKKKKGSSI
ncbi:MAG: PilT/PilU family type 4a pilus ATPase [Phycisphaerae bacterium]|nr:PilT/PilU family type 4a pilus ATPase [Phycisphaerae bacterium]